MFLNRLRSVAEACLYELGVSHQTFKCKVNSNCSIAAAFTFILAWNNAGIRLKLKVILAQQTNHTLMFIDQAFYSYVT